MLFNIILTAAAAKLFAWLLTDRLTSNDFCTHNTLHILWAEHSLTRQCVLWYNMVLGGTGSRVKSGAVADVLRVTTWYW